ncbi:hypothetical protein HYFRA_00006713 [Hymenoscyphus fraxineus]|uniref:Heterokaryon incompatibility domain-containing protein n=1 Tax=Hymenoscyphus fraxineus TaxID=746836 RepID=A0A9N9KVE7_9HELO|nr:hypothetical protein HYFRA_00006713 [Hymenoscyphus fraxineus]
MEFRTRADAIAFESRIGNWPRRLLKVEADKLISCEWREGNIYGGTKDPSYAAISYTWGRYELRQNEQTDVAAMDIRDEDGLPVPWRVPRIDPTKFTTQQILRLLRRVTIGPRLAYLDDNVSPVLCSEIEEFSSDTEVRFVWLDIACIDQREESPEKILEIGRQAAIFRGAYQTYVWLYHHESSFLRDVLYSIDEASKFCLERPYFLGDAHSHRAPSPQAEINWLSDCVRSLEILKEDSYFSSLWTLQEAFLCPHARMITRNGHIMLRSYRMRAYSSNGKDTMRNSIRTIYNFGGTLGRLVDQITINRRHANLDINASAFTQPENKLINMVTSLGLSVCSNNNAIELYGVTRERVTVERLDVIYAIQQVFNVRVGSSAADQNCQQSFTVLDLEQQLGSNILQTRPIQGMCFIHKAEVEFGQRWYISRWSKVPSPLLFTWDTPMELSCWISTAKLGAGVMVAHFNGKLCRLKSLAKRWDRCGTQNKLPSEYNEDMSAIPAGEEWDCPWLLEFDFGRGVGGFFINDLSSFPHDFTLFENHFMKDETLRVLHFALIGPHRMNECMTWWNLGLVLQLKTDAPWVSKTKSYERIGVTFWRSYLKFDKKGPTDLPTPTDIMNISTGLDSIWTATIGLVG